MVMLWGEWVLYHRGCDMGLNISMIRERETLATPLNCNSFI